MAAGVVAPLMYTLCILLCSVWSALRGLLCVVCSAHPAFYTLLFTSCSLHPTIHTLSYVTYTPCFFALCATTLCSKK